jgi:hypothetical protein
MDARNHWKENLVGLAVGKAAQRKFGAKDAWYDSWCSDDDYKIWFVARTVSATEGEAVQFVRMIEAEAEEFVDEHWDAIQRLGEILHSRVSLNEKEIRAVLMAVPSQQARKAMRNTPPQTL